jgi:S1-C subfamily serine protease
VRLRFDPFGLNVTREMLTFVHGAGAVDATGRTDEQPRTDRLGVICNELSAEERLERGLEGDLGLLVETIEHGSIAHALELQRGDVLIRIGTTELRVCEDIAVALAERGPTQALEIQILDTAGQTRHIRWLPG